MSTKSRLVKLEAVAAQVGKAAAKLIVCLVDDVTGTITHDGTKYSRAEWEAKRKAEGREDDTTIVVKREATAKDADGIAHFTDIPTDQVDQAYHDIFDKKPQ